MAKRDPLDEMFGSIYGCLMQIAYEACMDADREAVLAETTWADDGGAGNPDWLEIDGPNSTRRVFVVG